MMTADWRYQQVPTKIKRDLNEAIKFSDDTKSLRIIKTEVDCGAAEEAHDTRWAIKCFFNFSVEKCNVVYVGKTILTINTQQTLLTS